MAAETGETPPWAPVVAHAAQAWKAAQEPQPASSDDLARYALRLALNPRAWVRRRVETFEFLDAATVRRRMSVDVVLPPSSRFDSGVTVYVPLMLLKKRDLRNFDLRDEQSGALPLLNSNESGALAVRGLRRYLSAFDEVTDEHARVLGVVVTERVGQRAREALDGKLKPLLAAVPEADRDSVRELIEQLDDAFLVMAGIPYEPRSRRVLKFSYDLEHRTGESAGRLQRAYLFGLHLVASFGLLPRVERFEGLVVGLGESYHAEVVPPVDTYVDDARLKVADREPIVDTHRFRPHLHAVSESPGDRGTLTLLMHAQREGLVLPLLFSALAISGTLALVPRNADRLDGQTLAALLLVPFALAAFFIRSAENSYVTQMLRGVRVTAAAPVGAGVLTIAMLGLGFLDPPGEDTSSSTTVVDVARYAAWVSGGATALLAAAAVAPPVGRRVRPKIQWLVRHARGWSSAKLRASAGLAILIGCVLVALVVLWLVSRLLGLI